MKRLSKLYPVAAEKACSIGGVKIPFRSDGGRSLMVCGMGKFMSVKDLFRLEGQALFPVGVTEQEWKGEEEAGLEVMFGELTPIVVTVTKYEDSTVGAYSEVQVNALTTYHRMDAPFKRHTYLVPYMLEHVPSTRMYPILTITDSKQYAAVSKELFHLPTLYDPDLEVREEGGNIIGCKGKGLTGDCVGDIIGSEVTLDLGSAEEGLRERYDKWVAVAQTVGIERLFVNCLEGRRALKYTMPHGRGTVKGRMINDYQGRRNPPGFVSGIDLGPHAAQCGADFQLVYTNKQNQYLRRWGNTDTTSLPFQPDLVLHTNGLASVKLLPQPTVLPLHISDQKRGELKQLFLECQEVLETRQPYIERPDAFRDPTPLIDVHTRDRKLQGAQWKG